MTTQAPRLLEATGWSDYELLDTGQGRRLERCGPYRIVRPDPQALWQPALPDKEWARVHARFSATDEDASGHWIRIQDVPERWRVTYKDLPFWARLTPFRHLGFFPEQSSQWEWTSERLASARRPPSVLNLFGYTGLASFHAARQGADVTHVDASRKALGLARENQELAGMQDARIRWICDDATKFVQREQRRGRTYDGIILDPPKYGRGPKNERWDLFENLEPLVQICKDLLGGSPLFVIVTAYATQLSCVSLHNLLLPIQARRGGNIEYGELVLRDTAGARPVSTAIYARWSPQPASRA